MKRITVVLVLLSIIGAGWFVYSLYRISNFWRHLDPTQVREDMRLDNPAFSQKGIRSSAIIGVTREDLKEGSVVLLEDETRLEDETEHRQQPTNETPDVPIYVRTFGDQYAIEEKARGETFSYVESETPINEEIAALEARRYEGDIISEARRIANYGVIQELGCLRNFRYYFLLAQEQGEGFFIFFFTNDQKTPLTEVMGEKYSAAAQNEFNRAGYRKVLRHTAIPGTASCVDRLF